MMKGKIKYLFIIMICLFLTNVQEVFAANAEAGVVCKETNPNDPYALSCTKPPQDCSIRYEDGSCHEEYNIRVNYDGQSFEGYCADYGKHLGNINYGANYTCTAIEDGVIASILGNSSLNRNQKTKALRDYTTGSESTIPNSGGLSLTKINESGNVVTYSVSTALNPSDISFTCGSGCSNIQYSNGMVVVTADVGACSFTFTATYPGSVSTVTPSSGRVLRCTGQKLQDVYILDVSASSSSGGTTGTTQQGGMVTQSFSGEFDPNGSYYKEYCDENPNTCVCNEGPDVSMPSFCDDSGSAQNAYVHEPKNVTQCILNGRDQNGNSYKMNDGQISNGNKYCAVYCKEDYDMELPGAKYTQSGRFFTLENTKVTGKRSCYATNPNNDCNQPEILIEDFVQDVMNQQKALMDAFNVYQTAKAKYESVAGLTEEQVEKICTYNYYDTNTHQYETEKVKKTYVRAQTGVDKDKMVAASNLESNQSGKYNVYTTQATDKDSIGENFSCDGGANAAGTHVHIADYLKDMNDAKAVLNEAREKLKQTIDWMEECYNWNNNFCLDPVVTFDYEEQYNSSINYERVDGSDTTIVGSNATYSTSKVIDNEYTANEGGNLGTYAYAYCTEDNCVNGGEGTATNISTLIEHLYYRKVEAEGTAEYANTQEFQTHYPSGTIEPSTGGTRPNYSYLGTVYPVELNTPTGQYKWTLNFSNFGMKNESGCFLGRLDPIFGQLEYVCTYVVDCDDCDYDCVGEGCLIPDGPKCPECDVYCTNCIFNGDGMTFYYEARTVNDLHPNNAKGINWSNEKGKATTKEIEDVAEEVYKNAQFVYEMTPENMAAIRKYNAETVNYVNEHLTYHSIGNVSNAYGTSDFLDNGQKNGYFKEKLRTKERTLWSGGVSDGIGPVWKVGK